MKLIQSLQQLYKAGPYFTDPETEASRGKLANKDQIGGKWGSWDLNSSLMPEFPPWTPTSYYLPILIYNNVLIIGVLDCLLGWYESYLRAGFLC